MAAFGLPAIKTTGRFAVIKKKDHRGKEYTAEFPIPDRVSDDGASEYFTKEFCRRPFEILEIKKR